MGIRSGNRGRVAFETDAGDLFTRSPVTDRHQGGDVEHLGRRRFVAEIELAALRRPGNYDLGNPITYTKS